MKNLALKVYLSLFVWMAVAITGWGQVKRPHLLVGANASYSHPRGALAEGYNFGIGGEVFGGIGVGKTYVVGTVGASNFFANNQNSNGSLLYKPVKIGVRQFIVSNKIFVNGDVGMAYVKNKTMANSENKLTAGIGAGARVFGLEAGLYYNSWKAVDGNRALNAVQFKLGWGMRL